MLEGPKLAIRYPSLALVSVLASLRFMRFDKKFVLTMAHLQDQWTKLNDESVTLVFCSTKCMQRI